MPAHTSPAFTAFLPRLALGLILGIWAVPSRADETARSRSDRFGDPLPAGALVRLGTVRFRGDARHIAFAADGKKIVTAGWSGTAYLWDAASGKLLHRIKTKWGIDVLAVSPKGDRLAAAWGPVSLFDTATGKQLHELGKGHCRGMISALAFAPDGKVLATGTDNVDDPIMLWDVATGKHLRDFKGRLGRVYSLAYSPDGKQLASCGWDFSVRLWDPQSGTERGQLGGDDRISVVFADGGKFLASAGRVRQTIRVWDVASRKEVHQLAEKHGGVKALAVSPDGRMLACGNDDGTISLWEIRKGRKLLHWKVSSLAISSMAFSPDGKTLVSGSELECCPHRWDVATGRELGCFGGHRSTVNWMEFSPDGRHLYSSSLENMALRWDVRSGREECWFSLPTERFDFFLLSPDKKTAVTLAGPLSDGGGLIRLWDTATGKLQRVL